jgi:hypothetical protein
MKIKFIKSGIQSVTASLALCVLSFGFAPAVATAASYDATAELTLTLVSVTDVTGANWLQGGWNVNAEGTLESESTVDSGVATANNSWDIVPFTALNVGDSITQSASASGTATNGFAESDVFTALNIFVANELEEQLTFTFDFSLTTDAATTATGGSANANALVDVLDDLGFVDILSDVAASGDETLSCLLGCSGSFSIDLAFGVNNIEGFIDASGGADAVPVPAAVWLFGSGLLGLIGVARRRKA